MKLHPLLVAVALQLAVVRGDHHVFKKRQLTADGIAPLDQITSTMPRPVEPPFSTTHKPGDNGAIPGAPKIPVPKSLSAWPAQDQLAPMDTPEVDIWMKELDGFHIPNIRPTKDSVCASDPEAAQNAAKNGWWTCGHHIRPTDIVHCPNKWDWGTSYDDGPSPYTPLLLEKLKQHNLKTTFFVVGSRVVQSPSMLVEEYMRGHEISVHTWSHRPLTTLSTRQIVAELGYTRAAIKSVIGITPTTMRPPRGDIDDRVRAISLAMGLVPIMWTVNDQQGSFDTFDWLIPDNQSNGTHHLQVFTEIVNKKGVEIPTGFVTLQHDLYPTTVGVSVKYTMDVALNHQPKYNMRPIGECNNIPVTDLYFETTTNKTFPYTNHTVNILGTSTGGAVSSAASYGLLSLASLATLGLLL